MAAELGGVAQAVVELTAAHLRERVQFGRPLAQFQALRHRVANLAVDAEATRWMAREAAYSGQARPMWLAAAYAAAAGAALSPDAVQAVGCPRLRVRVRREQPDRCACRGCALSWARPTGWPRAYLRLPLLSGKIPLISVSEFSLAIAP